MEDAQELRALSGRNPFARGTVTEPLRPWLERVGLVDIVMCASRLLCSWPVRAVFRFPPLRITPRQIELHLEVHERICQNESRRSDRGHFRRIRRCIPPAACSLFVENRSSTVFRRCERARKLEPHTQPAPTDNTRQTLRTVVCIDKDGCVAICSGV